VTGYRNHHTMTPSRLAQLRAVARGQRPQINRALLRWYLRNGYLERGAPEGDRPQFALTDKGWQATGIPRCDVAASPMQAVVFLGRRT
jgi:hypothetical protein